MAPLSAVGLTLVDSVEECLNLKEWMGQRRPWLGLDIETTGVNIGRDRVRTVQVGDADKGWTVPVERYGYGAVVTEVLRDYDGMVALHNSVFDGSFLVRDEVPWFDAQIDDTMVMTHLKSSGYSAALKSVSNRIVDRHASDGQGALKEAMKANGWDWSTVPVDFPAYWGYGAMDAVLTARIAEKLWPEVQPYRKSYDIEMGAIGVLRGAQITGMRIDLDYAKMMIEHLTAEMQRLELDLPNVNVNSGDQLIEYFTKRTREVLGEDLADVVPMRTKTGKIAMDKDALQLLGNVGMPEAPLMVAWRKADDLRSNYFMNLLELHTDGVVHPNIRVLGAEKTGRMSISRPALQTLPKSKVGRNAFLAREGHTLIMADFDGMEMRMLADIAGEAQMLKNFRDGVDQHSWLASQVYKKTVGKGDPERVVAKAAGFAKVYGAGVPKFAQTAGIRVSDAETFMHMYDGLFPGVKRFQEESAQAVNACRGRKWGAVSTWTGRRLMVPKDDAYKSVNYRIQGGCAELTKLKLAELANAGLGDAVRIPIHDEIVFEVPDGDVSEAVRIIQEVMVEKDLFRVEFPIEIETAKRWGDVYDK